MEQLLKLSFISFCNRFNRNPIPFAACFIAIVWLWRVWHIGTYGFPFHQGATEILYSSRALGEWPTPYQTPYPFRYWPIHLSFEMFGVSERSARFPSTVAFLFSASAAIGIGWGIRDRLTGAWCGIVFASTPSVLVWFGRAMPDAWVTLGILLACCGAALAHRNVWFSIIFLLGIGVAVGSKPIGAVAPLAILLSKWPRGTIPIAVSCVLGLFIALLVGIADDVWSYIGIFEDRESIRTPFEYSSDVLYHGVLYGCAFAAWFGFLMRDWRIGSMAFVLVLFALYDAPEPGHHYYFLPGASLVAVSAGFWGSKNPKLLASAILLTFLFSMPQHFIQTGDAGDNRLMDAYQSLPDGTVVDTPGPISSFAGWYGLNPKSRAWGQPVQYDESGYFVDFIIPDRDSCLLLSSYSYHHSPRLGVWYCD